MLKLRATYEVDEVVILLEVGVVAAVAWVSDVGPDDVDL